MTSEFVATACPHDCPSTCALEVERLAPDRIGAVISSRPSSGSPSSARVSAIFRLAGLSACQTKRPGDGLSFAPSETHS